MDTSTECTTSSDESISKEKRFMCSHVGCSKKFAKNRKLVNHIRLHSDERPFHCDIKGCDKKYTNSSHLRRHKKTNHEPKAPIMCTIDGCGREMVNGTNLKKHMYRFHNQNRIYSFTCSECKQGFHRKKQLQQHSYLHTGELPFSCEQCNAKFITICEKNRHKRVHKTYTCDCGDVCDKWTSLLAHKKICKLKRLKCNICAKTFANKPNLKAHVKTHIEREDRNIFVCPYDDCTRYYYYNTNLIVHINRFHKKVSRPKIPCTYEGCDKLLSKMQNYKVHLKTHEGTEKKKGPRRPRKDKGIPKMSELDKLFSITKSMKSQLAKHRETKTKCDVTTTLNDEAIKNNNDEQIIHVKCCQ